MAKQKTAEQIMRAQIRKEYKMKSEFYNLNSILGNDWALFYILIGAREAGKSYAVMEYCLRQWKQKKTPFTWIRLTTTSTQKMLANKADKLVDPDLRRKYDLELTTKGMDVYDHGEKMCKVLALSEMAKEKGVALFDKDYDGYYNIVCDEFQREPGEVKRFDIVYNLVGTLENLCRSRKDKIRIFMICNLLENANDVLVAFNFIPEQYGRYKLKKKRAVIDYIPPTEQYLNRRKGTIADLLTPEASNFTNKLKQDRTRLFKGNLGKPQTLIKFFKEEDTWFVLWSSGTICKYNKEKLKNVIAMRPYLDEVFEMERRDNVIHRFDSRSLYFRNLITQQTFQKQMEMVRTSK